MSKTIRTTNTKCRALVQERTAFKNSNGQLYGVSFTPLLYVVYSYGEHWPLFVHDGFDWYENEDKFSPTTSHHHGYAHPHKETIKRSCRWLRTFISEHQGQYRALHDVQSRLGLAA